MRHLLYYLQICLAALCGLSAAGFGTKAVAEDSQTANSPVLNPNTAISPGATNAAPKYPKPVIVHMFNLRAVRALKAPIFRYPPAETNLWTQRHLSDEWLDYHRRMETNGIDFSVANFNDVMGDVSGGKARGVDDINLTVLSFDLYTTQLGLWHDGQFHTTSYDAAGPPFTAKNTGSLNYADYIEAYNYFSMFELWYGQKVLKSTLELRVGKIFPYVLIGKSTPATSFMNGSFDYPTFMDFGLRSAFLVAPMGAEAIWNPVPAFTFIGFVGDGWGDTSGGAKSDHGLHVTYTSQSGLESLMELQYKVHPGFGAPGLPATFKLGLEVQTSHVNDLYRNQDGQSLALDGGTPETHSFNYSPYFIVDQMLYREGATGPASFRGLTAFWKIEGAPDDANLVSFTTAGGLFYEGLIPGRDHDVLAVGATYTKISDDFRHYQEDEISAGTPGITVDDAETVFETTYQYEVAPWWILQPDFQYIIHPGGSSAVRNAVVVGLSSRISF